MKNKRVTWIALVVLAGLGVVGVGVGIADAQTDTRGQRAAADRADGDADRPARPDRGARLQERLGLTDAQVEQFASLRTGFRTDHEAVREQMRTKRAELVALFQGASLSRSDLLAKQREIHELAGRVGERRMEMMYATWQILTPEQRAQAGEMLGRLGDGAGRRGHVRGHGRGLHDGPGDGAGRGLRDGSGGQGRGRGDGPGQARGPRDGSGGQGRGPRDGSADGPCGAGAS
jgi:Spy/CpxP family protein refolding chaperone